MLMMNVKKMVKQVVMLNSEYSVFDEEVEDDGDDDENDDACDSGDCW